MAFDDEELDPEEPVELDDELEEEDDLEIPDEDDDDLKKDEDELDPKNLGAQGFGIEEDEPETY